LAQNGATIHSRKKQVTVKAKLEKVSSDKLIVFHQFINYKANSRHFILFCTTHGNYSNENTVMRIQQLMMQWVGRMAAGKDDNR